MTSIPVKERAIRGRSQVLTKLAHWKLEDAKARFSEVVRLAGSDGPQLVTIRGREAAVILTAEEYERLLPESEERQPLMDYLRGLGLDEFSLDREKDTGRDIAL